MKAKASMKKRQCSARAGAVRPLELVTWSPFSKTAGEAEPCERYLADAFAGMLAGAGKGAGKGASKRPELVVVVSHEVTQRGWSDVREGEVCKIPGVGPVSPEVARTSASKAARFSQGARLATRDRNRS